MQMLIRFNASGLQTTSTRKQARWQTTTGLKWRIRFALLIVGLAALAIALGMRLTIYNRYYTEHVVCLSGQDVHFNGHAVDVCAFRTPALGDYECGQPAADLVCKYRGYVWAYNWTQSLAAPKETTISLGNTVDGGLQVFTDICCDNKAYWPSPPRWLLWSSGMMLLYLASVGVTKLILLLVEVTLVKLVATEALYFLNGVEAVLVPFFYLISVVVWTRLVFWVMWCEKETRECSPRWQKHVDVLLKVLECVMTCQIGRLAAFLLGKAFGWAYFFRNQLPQLKRAVKQEKSLKSMAKPRWAEALIHAQEESGSEDGASTIRDAHFIYFNPVFDNNQHEEEQVPKQSPESEALERTTVDCSIVGADSYKHPGPGPASDDSFLTICSSSPNGPSLPLPPSVLHWGQTDETGVLLARGPGSFQWDANSNRCTSASYMSSFNHSNGNVSSFQPQYTSPLWDQHGNGCASLDRSWEGGMNSSSYLLSSKGNSSNISYVFPLTSNSIHATDYPVSPTSFCAKSVLMKDQYEQKKERMAAKQLDQEGELLHSELVALTLGAGSLKTFQSFLAKYQNMTDKQMEAEVNDLANRLFHNLKSGLLRCSRESLFCQSPAWKLADGGQGSEEEECILFKDFVHALRRADKQMPIVGIRRSSNSLKTATKAWQMFDKEDAKLLKLDDVRTTLQDIYKVRRNLALSIRANEAVSSSLQKAINFGIQMSLMFVYLTIFDIPYLTFARGLDYFKTYVIVVSFLFRDFFKTIFNNIIYLLGEHPYDVGDEIEFHRNTEKERKWVVSSFNLMYTVLTSKDGGDWSCVANAYLTAAHPINRSRTKRRKEKFKITVPADVPMEIVPTVIEAMTKLYNEKYKEDMAPKGGIKVRISDMPDSQTLVLTCKFRFSNPPPDESRCKKIKKAMKDLIIATLLEAKLQGIPLTLDWGMMKLMNGK